MLELLQGLADLCGVRDRNEQDRSLVRLAYTACHGQVLLVRLVQLESDDEKPLWQTVAAYPADAARLPPDAALPRARHLPIALNGSVVARLEVFASAPLTEAHDQALEAVVRAYQNLLELLEFGERDALTGLHNRKSFDNAFSTLATSPVSGEGGTQTLGTIDRRQGDCAPAHWLAVLDIDHFKRVNDQFGHLIGDEVLVLMARLMQSNFRSRDKLYRFGGEEFVVLLYGMNAAQAAAAFERLRSRIAEQSFPQVGAITLSLGYTQVVPDDTPTGAVGRADKAVYYAKGHGRNQVCCYEALVAGGLLDSVPEPYQDVDFF